MNLAAARKHEGAGSTGSPQHLSRSLTFLTWWALTSRTLIFYCARESGTAESSTRPLTPSRPFECHTSALKQFGIVFANVSRSYAVRWAVESSRTPTRTSEQLWPRDASCVTLRSLLERTMTKIKSSALLLSSTVLLASCLLVAQVLPKPGEYPLGAKPSPMMNFFVTSEPIGDGGNLGGLAGADAHCQALATVVAAGNRTWHAYLSTQARPGQPAVNARDRIGEGPWYNFKGEMIAQDLAHLHGDTMELAHQGNNLNKLTGLTEKGQIVPGLYDYSDPRDNDWDYVKTTRFSTRHEMLTGTRTDGTAFTDGLDHTCDNWISNKSPAPGTSNGNLNAADGRPNAQIGFPDRNGGGSGSWNSAHGTRGCAQADLPKTHGVGLFYCFAIN